MSLPSAAERDLANAHHNADWLGEQWSKALREKEHLHALLTAIIDADTAYDTAIDQDHGGEDLHKAFSAVWQAIDTARAALSARSLEVKL